MAMMRAGVGVGLGSGMAVIGSVNIVLVWWWRWCQAEETTDEAWGIAGSDVDFGRSHEDNARVCPEGRE